MTRLLISKIMSYSKFSSIYLAYWLSILIIMLESKVMYLYFKHIIVNKKKLHHKKNSLIVKKAESLGWILTAHANKIYVKWNFPHIA